MNRYRLNPIMGLLLLLTATIAIALVTSAPGNTTPAQTPADSSATATSVTSVAAQSSATVLPTQQGSTPGPTSMSETVPTPTEEEKQVMDDIYSGRLRGEIIARGSNFTPVPLERTTLVTSYEVEEISLPISVTMERRVPVSATELQARIVTFDRVWVFSLLGGPVGARSLFWSIWLDDQIIGDSGGGADGIGVIVYDGTLLREGATIGVSYGWSKPDRYLSERLHFIRPPKLP